MAARTTTIAVLVGSTVEYWDVPRGFGALYRRVARDHLDLIAKGRPGKLIGQVQDLLRLVGYEASSEVIAEWPLRKRIEAEIYAANVHARAGDNPVQRYPKPDWLPDPWQGPPPDLSHIREDLRGAFAGPGPTEVR